MKLHLHVVCLSNINSREVKSFRRLPHFCLFSLLGDVNLYKLPNPTIVHYCRAANNFFLLKGQMPPPRHHLGWTKQNFGPIHQTKGWRCIQAHSYDRIPHCCVQFVNCFCFITSFYCGYSSKIWPKRIILLLSDLLPLHPATLRHKNPQICKIIHGMRAVGCKDRSIDLNMCICRNIQPTRTWF